MFYSKVYTSFLMCSVFCVMCTDAREMYVSPGGSETSNCSEKAKCTLDRALQLASGLNSTTIFASEGNHSLKTSHNFTRIASFALIGGRSRHDVQITCEPNVSLSFSLSENITFGGVRFRKCAGWHRSSVGVKKNYPNLEGAKFRTALDFRYCRDLRMYNVEISSCPGLGVNLHNVGGTVNFTDCLFTDNFISHERRHDGWEDASGKSGKYIYSGGGVYAMLNAYGYDTVNVTPREHDSYQHNNSYEFTGCHFRGNRALWLNADRAEEVNTPERPFSRGGGLAVYFLGKASGCLIKIKSCVFARNHASWGGGLQVEMSGTTQNNTLEVEATEFSENCALLAGGGVRIGNLPKKGTQLRINRFTMTNCSFVDNNAIYGGGGSLYGTTIPRKFEKHTHPVVTQFDFHGCHWQENEGSVGAALAAYLYNENEDLIGPEVPYHVCFQNDTWFRFNRVNQLHLNLTIGQGTLYSLQVPLIFQGSTHFVNNSQSALLLDGSSAKVYDRLDFIGNTGVRGGAIAMYGRSRIILQENTSTLTFEANKCSDKGGALYIQAPGAPLVSYNSTGADMQACFFGYSDSSKDFNHWNTTVVFRDNNASLGHAVYATTLKNCRQAGESRQHNSVLKWKFITFANRPLNSTSLQDIVATDPVDIVHNESDWEVSPGEVFDATVQLFDEVGNVIPGIVDVTVENSSVKLANPSTLFLTTRGKITNISLLGDEGSSFTVKLGYAGGGQALEEMVENGVLKKCHAGFKIDKTALKCECMKAQGVWDCDSDGKTVYIKEGYWAGHVDGEFATHFCPTGYCNPSTSNDYNYKYIKGSVCSDTRNQSSVLCGKCKNDSFTVTFGSERCVQDCRNWHVIIALFVCILFLVVVVVVMLIDLDIATGYLNAWLYSYQIMKLLTPDGFEFDPVIEFVIAFTNVHVDISDHSFCLLKGLNDADKLFTLSLIPLFVLVAVSVLKCLVDRFPDWCFSRKVLRTTPNAPYRAVCTIFVLCYTDITRISLTILRPAKIGSKTFLYDYGGYEYFQGRHLVYFIISILYIVVIVLPFPVLLLFRPSLTNFFRPVFDLNRWNLYLDAFQGCFKDQYRWFAAFYFICRLAILLLNLYLPAGPVKRVLLEGACILILFIFALLRPYKGPRDVTQGEQDRVERREVRQVNPAMRRIHGVARRGGNGEERGEANQAGPEREETSYEWINRLDILLLTNLSLITVISSPLATDNDNKALTTAVKVLAWVPLAVLFVLGCRMLRTYCNANCVPEEDEQRPILSTSSVTPYGSQAGTPEGTFVRPSSRASNSSII